MAYRKFENISGPDAVLECISEYALDMGWDVLADCVSDTPVDGSSTASDGNKLIIKSPDGELFINFRSANGKPIFPKQALASIHGIGLVCSTFATANPPSGMWYDQENVPKLYGTDEVIGVGIPCHGSYSYNVYVNIVMAPTPLLSVHIENEGVFQHLAAAYVHKLGDWDGGVIFSGSRNSYQMGTQSYEPLYIDTNSLPLFCTSSAANTFLRIDMDAAPLRNPAVYWASAGPTTSNYPACYTGKQLSTPIKASEPSSTMAWDAKIPHYWYLQSQTAADSGRNVNTLNCISVNLPIVLYGVRDPDGRRNFSPLGYVPGVYFISTKNIAPAQVYEIHYPNSGNLHQVFPMTQRKGRYGYDGISVQQVDSES